MRRCWNHLSRTKQEGCRSRMNETPTPSANNSTVALTASKSFAMFLIHHSQLADRNRTAGQPETSSWNPSLSLEVLYKWGEVDILEKKHILWHGCVRAERGVQVCGRMTLLSSESTAAIEIQGLRPRNHSHPLRKTLEVAAAKRGRTDQQGTSHNMRGRKRGAVVKQPGAMDFIVIKLNRNEKSQGR